MPSLLGRFGVRQIEHELAVDTSAMSLRPEFESRQGRQNLSFGFNFILKDTIYIQGVDSIINGAGKTFIWFIFSFGLS